MSNRSQDNAVPASVQAFADGELTGNQSAELLDQMAADPQVTKQVKHQQQLRDAVGRHLVAATPVTPDDLRQKVQAAMTSSPSTVQAGEPRAESNPIIARIGRWMPAAVAAMLLIATGLMLYVARTDSGAPAGDQTALIQPAKVNQFARRHVTCTTQTAQLHVMASVDSLGDAPEAIARHIGTPPPRGLDLSSIGYTFDQIGECRVPCKQAVHLIYRADAKDGRHDAISLWLSPYQGQPGIEENKLYEVTSDDFPHPMMMWRHGKTVYHLMGDQSKAVKQASSQLMAAM